MTLRLLVIALTLLASAGPAAASDLPWGGDTLPYLINKADLIVRGRVTGAALLAERHDGPGYSVHLVRSREVLKGASAAGRSLPFVAPESYPVASPRSDAFVFLKQLEASTAQAVGAPGPPAYVVVSGGYGVVDAGSSRAAAINQLLAAGRDPARLEAWAKPNVRSSDVWLQRSAVQLLHDHADEPWSVQRLGEVVRTAAASLETREFAIQALADSAHASAAPMLRRLATEPLPDVLRRALADKLASQ
jgi:hypothetical protein